MKADILIKDENETSCIITIYYTKFEFDAWFSGSKPFGPGTSGDCSRFGVNAIHLRDGYNNGRPNLLNLSFGARILIPQVMIVAGTTGKGYVISSGFLQSGDITWEIWNTRRTGAWGDGSMEEK